MHFTTSTIAAAALFLTAEAAPHHRWGGGNWPFPSGGFSGFPGFGQPTGGAPSGPAPTGVFPTGGFPAPTGGAPFPSGGFPGAGTGAPSGIPEISATAPPTAPTGAPVEDVSSISFELPASAQAEDEEATPTSLAAEPTSTFGSGNWTIPSTGGSGSASSTFPEAAGESTLSEPMTITDSFDGGLVRFGRGVDCGGQAEGGDSDAVFILEEGATLSNVIIGADQIEGVHCLGSCTIENVWWEAVCEDALTIKQESGISTVNGGGAKGASDKVVQHNGGGTVAISNFYVSDFGKLYRSCGNCKTMYERHVTLDGVLAEGGTSTAVGINTNYGDTATITNSCIDAKEICTEFEGNDTGDEPEKISTGPSSSCIYTDADISAC